MNFPGPDQVAGWGAPQQPPAQPKRGKAPVVVLAVLAAVFAITAGLFTVMYFGAQSEVDRAAAEQIDREAGLKTVGDRLRQAEDDAKAAADKLGDVRGRNSSLKSERDKLDSCTEAAGRYLDTKPDTPERDEWFDKMYDRCRSI